MEIFYIPTDESSPGPQKKRDNHWIERGIAVTSGFERYRDRLAKPTKSDLLAMCVKDRGIVAFGIPKDDIVRSVTNPSDMVNPVEPYEFHREVHWFLDLRMEPLSSSMLKLLGCPIPQPTVVRQIRYGHEALRGEIVRRLSKVTPDEAEYAVRSGWIMRIGLRVRPNGVLKPVRIETSVTKIARDPQVRAWVMQRSKGHCEQCNSIAPFLNANGEGYLECHHIHRLASDGSDTVYNTAALCPNCHREQHSGMEAEKRKIHLAEAVRIKECLFDEVSNTSPN